MIANIVGQGIVLLSSAVFTRMMSKSDYGLVSTYSTWVLVLNTFLCLNLFITVRNAYIDFREDYDAYNSSVLVLSIGAGVVFTLLLVAITRFTGTAFGMAEVLLACIQSIALNIVNYMLAIQSMKNEYRQRAILMIAPNWVHVFLSIVLMLIFAQHKYMAKIAGNALGMLVFGVVCAAVIWKRSFPRILPTYWKYALRISVASIFHTLSDLILMQCDRLMLAYMVGVEETAEYSVIYNVSAIIVAIYQALNGAWTPWFYKQASKPDSRSTRKYQEYYLVLFAVFACGMMTISPEVIKLISPGNYWAGIRYVAPLVMASYLIFLYAFFTGFLMYKKETARIAGNTMIAAVLNLILNYILIPRYKAAGAVMATVFSYIVLLILHLISIGKEGRTFFSMKAMWMSMIALTMYGAFFYFIRDIWQIRYVSYAVLVVVFYFVKGRKMMAEFIEDRK